jgi:hypothetical protein
MGNITQLHQGSLNGLRRQTNECLENAYRKGYEDGKKEPREVKAVNVEDTNEYQIGYKAGRKDGFAYCRNNTELIDELKQAEYNKGLEDFENLFVHEHDYKQFFEDTYGSKDPDYNLFDLVAKYGAKKVVNDFNKWQEEKKKVEEESIKVGDIVIHKDDKIKGVVYRVEDGLAYGTNCYLNSFEWATNLCTKVGHIDEMKTLLDKLRGEDNE